VATGWTECLPVLNRGREEVLAGLQRARTLFPFPILGIDTDNGGEFLNEDVVAYCAREQITFTRGRPYEKRDQCFIEQKNGVVVRQVVGRDRLEGEHAARQLTELYRALRLYVNCFQPSMKLLAKECEGRKVRRISDPAKTPLQRLLLSGVLPVSQQCELRAVARTLDPLRLFQQLQQLQHAIFRCAVGCSLMGQEGSASPLLVFASEQCTTGLPVPKGAEATAGSPLQHRCQESLEDASVLTWRRTCKDPFVGQWEQILSWMQADPTRTSGDILREFQVLFPGRYHPQQVRTLQRGLRKIRAHLLTTREEQWQQELIPTAQFQRQEAIAQQSSSSPLPVQPVDSSLGTTRPPHPLTEAPLASADRRAIRSTTPGSTSSGRKKNRPRRTSLPPVRCESEICDPGKDHRLTIEQAITSYIAHHHSVGHRAKTLEWHQTALGQFRKYVQVERHLLSVCQITEADLQNWFVFLAQTPTKAGKHRAASTIETYARSVRAFCCWLVQQGDLPSSPLGEEGFPRTRVPFPHLIQPETFDRLVQAAFPQDAVPRAKKMAARDRALLWVLFDTGISVCNVCALCVSDLDRKTGTLRVRGKGGKERQRVLGAPCLGYLLGALDQSCVTQGTRAMRKRTGTDPLFCTEHGRLLTKNSLALLFRRLRTRAGMDEIPISPKIFRHSFALRYLQAGGNPQGVTGIVGV
jgi:site-specific recombinase XerD